MCFNLKVNELDSKALNMFGGTIRVMTSSQFNFKDDGMVYLVAVTMKNTKNMRVLAEFKDEEVSKDDFVPRVETLLSNIKNGLYRMGHNLLLNGEIILNDLLIMSEIDALEGDSHLRYFTAINKYSSTIDLVEYNSNKNISNVFDMIKLSTLTHSSHTSKNIIKIKHLTSEFLERTADIQVKLIETISEYRKENLLNYQFSAKIENVICVMINLWLSNTDMLYRFKEGAEIDDLVDVISNMWRYIDKELYSLTYGPEFINDDLVLIQTDEEEDWDDILERPYFCINSKNTAIYKEEATKGPMTLSKIYKFSKELVDKYSENRIK